MFLCHLCYCLPTVHRCNIFPFYVCKKKRGGKREKREHFQPGAVLSRKRQLPPSLNHPPPPPPGLGKKKSLRTRWVVWVLAGCVLFCVESSFHFFLFEYDGTLCLDEAHRWKSTATIEYLRTHGLHSVPNLFKTIIGDRGKNGTSSRASNDPPPGL